MAVLAGQVVHGVVVAPSPSFDAIEPELISELIGVNLIHTISGHGGSTAWIGTVLLELAQTRTLVRLEEIVAEPTREQEQEAQGHRVALLDVLRTGKTPGRGGKDIAEMMARQSKTEVAKLIAALEGAKLETGVIWTVGG